MIIKWMLFTGAVLIGLLPLLWFKPWLRYMCAEKGSSGRALYVIFHIVISVVIGTVGFYIFEWVGPIKSCKEMIVTVTSKRIDQERIPIGRGKPKIVHLYRLEFNNPDGVHVETDVPSRAEYNDIHPGDCIGVVEVIRFWGDTVYNYSDNLEQH